MPTEFRESGFRFVIFTDDHGIPHVHAIKDGAFVKIGIGNETEGAFVMKISGMRSRDVLAAVRIVNENWARLLTAWRKYHG